MSLRSFTSAYLSVLQCDTPIAANALFECFQYKLSGRVVHSVHPRLLRQRQESMVEEIYRLDKTTVTTDVSMGRPSCLADLQHHTTSCLASCLGDLTNSK